MRLSRRAAALTAGLLVAALAAAGCGSGAGAEADDDALVVYNAQHEGLMKLMVDGFTKETGIAVRLRNGDDFELANQILQEGDASPADVFVTENSPAMSLVDSRGGFAKLDAATLAQVPKQFTPSTGGWTGFAGRATVFVHDPRKVPAAELPRSVMDLADPQWKGRVGIAAAGADFQAIVSAVLALKGEAATKAWLAGLKRNATVYRGNVAVMKAVNAGEIDAGVIYHYYWYRDRAENRGESTNTQLHFFGHKDPGAFLGVSGAGVVEASKQQAEAKRLVAFLTGPAGQKILAQSDALEYSLSTAVPPSPQLKPLAQVDPPAVEISSLNGPKVVELMQDAGLL